MISFNKHSGIYTMELKQTFPISMDEAWEFFSNPVNLSKITPEHMGFSISSRPEEKMYPGQIITYTIGIFPGIKSSWVTEITHVKPKEYFVDEQRFGPYRMWHHEHHFKPVEQGIEMRDKVSYKIPFGLLGQGLHALFIQRQLKKIFSYRFKILNEKFTDHKRNAA